jgi:hypothetical protein
MISRQVDGFAQMLGKKLITPYIFAILSSLIMVLITGMNGF